MGNTITTPVVIPTIDLDLLERQMCYQYLCGRIQN